MKGTAIPESKLLGPQNRVHPNRGPISSMQYHPLPASKTLKAEHCFSQGMTTYDIRCKNGFDIRLIFLISSCWIRSKNGCYQRFFKFFLPGHCPMVSGWYLGLSSIYFLIICWNLWDIWSRFSLISVHITSDIRLIWFISWYPMCRCPAKCYPFASPPKTHLRYIVEFRAKIYELVFRSD